MYSPRVAYQEGRRIGRQLVVTRISDTELRDIVRRQIGPLISLRRSDEDRRLDSMTALFSCAISLAVFALAGLAYLLIEPDFLPSITVGPGVRLWVTLAAAVLVPLAIVAGLAMNHAQRAAEEADARAHAAILDAAWQGARDVLDARRTRAGQSVHRASPMTGGARPDPVFGAIVSPREAEELAAEWMRSLGASDAQVTVYIGDGGIDVASSRFIAQVKHHAAPVSAGAVRELIGVAAANGDRRRMLFFSTAGYQRGAVETADRGMVALFHMVPESGDLRACNDIAKVLLREGLV